MQTAAFHVTLPGTRFRLILLPNRPVKGCLLINALLALLLTCKFFIAHRGSRSKANAQLAQLSAKIGGIIMIMHRPVPLIVDQIFP